MKTFLVLLLAANAWASQTIQPKAQAQALYRQILGTGSTASLTCSSDSEDCTVDWTPKSGVVINFTDAKAANALLMIELGTLEAKIDAGTATTPDMMRMIKIILKLKGLSTGK